MEEYRTPRLGVSAEYRLTVVEKSTSQCEPMDLHHFLERAGRYCQARGISESRLGTLLFNDGAKFASLRAGRDVGVRRLQRAAERLTEMERDLGSAVLSDASSPDPAPAGIRNSEEVFR